MSSKGKDEPPKLPLNPYFRYRMKRLLQMDKDDKNRSKKIKIEWSEMDSKEKKKIQDEYYEELDEYHDLKKKYEEKHGVQRKKSKGTKRREEKSSRRNQKSNKRDESGRKDRNASSKRDRDGSARRDRSASNRRGDKKDKSKNR